MFRFNQLETPYKLQLNFLSQKSVENYAMISVGF